jgi:hypothetical protein
LGTFLLTSDAVLATFTRRPDMQVIIGQLPPADIDALNTITYTIGGMVLWPGNQIDGKWTINQARGCTGRIADRFDLTVECVRRHYEGDTTHPLADAFGRYRDFFDLFGSFAGSVHRCSGSGHDGEHRQSHGEAGVASRLVDRRHESLPVGRRELTCVDEIISKAGHREAPVRCG